MTQSEAILEYIDGTLDHDAEQRLFESMARQPDLRSTLRQFISIGQAVHADREAYAPPVDVEQALLAGLGIPPIVDMAAGAAGAGLMARLGLTGWWIWGMVGSFILGALLAGGTVYMATDSSRANVIATGATGSATNGSAGINGSTATATTNGNAAGIPSNGSVSTNGSAGTNGTATSIPSNGSVATNGSIPSNGAMARGGANGSNGLPMMGTADGAGTNIPRNSVSRNRIAWNNGSRSPARFRSGGSVADGSRSVDNSGNSGGRSGNSTVLRPDNGGADSNGAASRVSSESASTRQDAGASAPTIALITRAAPRGVPMAVPDALLSRAPLGRSPEPLPASSISPLDVEAGDPATVIGEVHGNVGASLTRTNALGSAAAGALEHVGIGVYWQLSPRFALGVEMGREAYDQVLHFNTGDTASVEQRPIYFWGGATARYYFGTIGAIGLEPFMQGTIGVASAGPIGRVRLGARHDFSGGENDFSITGGLEASGLAYTSNGNPALSGRWGAILGLEARLW